MTSAGVACRSELMAGNAIFAIAVSSEANPSVVKIAAAAHPRLAADCRPLTLPGDGTSGPSWGINGFPDTDTHGLYLRRKQAGLQASARMAPCIRTIDLAQFGS